MLRVPLDGVGARSGSSSTATERTICVATSDWTSRLSGEGPLVRLGPQLRLAARVDQLRGDPHAIGLGSDGAFHQIVRAQGVADLANASRRRWTRMHDERAMTPSRSAHKRPSCVISSSGEAPGKRLGTLASPRWMNGRTASRCFDVAAAAATAVRSVAAVHALDSRDEAVAAAMQRLDEARPLGVVAEHGAQPLDRGVQTVLEVDERAVRPQPVAQLVARQQFARMFEHQREHGERLILQAKPHAVFAQLARA